MGGGLAGLASAVALGSAGFEVDIYEARNFLGGRATSWPVGGTAGGIDAEMIDNCQHVLLRCCVNLLDLYRRLGVESKIRFHREFYFIEPGGRTSTLKRGLFPAPAHFFGIVPEAQVPQRCRQDRGRPRDQCDSARAPDAQRSRPHHHARLASRKAPDKRRDQNATGARCWSAPSMKNWTGWQRHTGFRSSGWV